jgi:hypothetical protein
MRIKETVRLVDSEQGANQMLMSRFLAHCADRVSGGRSRPFHAPLLAAAKTVPVAL